MGRRVAALLVGATVAAGGLEGCINLAEIEGGRSNLASSLGGREAREHQLGLIWSGRTRGDLEREWGSPTFVLNVPGFPDVTAIVMVFVGKQNNSGCIDAFVVQLDYVRTISGYVCR